MPVTKKLAAQGCDLVKQPLIDFEQGLSQILSAVTAITDTESVPLDQAFGRVLAQPVNATINVPLHANSAMDGYAFHADDISKTGHGFPVAFTQYAGDPLRSLSTGQCARIFTGAVIPDGVAAVEMQERCLVSENSADADNITENEHALVSFRQSLSASQNIRLAGEDIQIGQALYQSGHLLTSADVSVLASIGLAEVICYRQCRVAFLYSGDELLSPGQTISVGQVYNSNRYSLMGLLRQLACQFIDMGRVEDSLAASQQALTQAAMKADLILSTGGASVGDADYMRDAIVSLGTLKLWRLKLKPGKPVAFGEINDTPFLALPGNPVSAYVTFMLIAQQVIKKRQGMTDLTRVQYRLPLLKDWTAAVPREEYIRVRLVMNNGRQMLDAHPRQGSGVMTSITWATGLAQLPVDSQLKAGDEVLYIPLDGHH